MFQTPVDSPSNAIPAFVVVQPVRKPTVALNAHTITSSTGNMVLTDEWPKFEKDVQYSDASQLNTFQTCIPRPTTSHDRRRLWVIYIHGGAWCDPCQTATTFNKAQDLLLKSRAVEEVAGFASINYRLSPAPFHSTHPSNPADPARNATHPDHINDVLKALLHLQETYDFGARYILVGHSCGATLALQVAMKRYWGKQYESTEALELNVAAPLAIVGIEGLYDLPALVKWHKSEPYYQNFVEAAFGPEEKNWREVSPTASDMDETWPDGVLVVIAHSREDELVEWEQPELMVKSLRSQDFKDTGDRRVRFLELQGKHDQVWEEGIEVAKAIEFAIHDFKAPQ